MLNNDTVTKTLTTIKYTHRPHDQCNSQTCFLQKLAVAGIVSKRGNTVRYGLHRRVAQRF